MPTVVHSRFSLYLLINAAFILVVGIAYAISHFPDPRWLHLILLFALCSSPIIDLDGLNGRNALLALFMFVYFVSFGVGDLSNLLTGGDFSESQAFYLANALLSNAEIVILVGGIMFLLGYRVAAWQVRSTPSLRTPRDWSKWTIVFIGLILSVLGTIATYRWNVYIVSDTTNEAYRKGLASVSATTVTVYLIAGMCQPLGMLLLAYAWTVYRDGYLAVIVIAMIIIQLLIGFVVDIKGMAMIGIILVMLTSVLIRGRLPKTLAASGVLFVVVIYPYFTAYRTAIHGAGISRTAVVANFGEILQKTIAAKDKVNTGRDRAQTFLERANVKGSVDIIVRKTGNGVPFQWGYTLSPILQTFIPKVLWPDKVRIPTGQFFNRQFHIVEGDDVYISPSHLGELYWNFGWAGVVLGMGIVGLICGWVGARFNLAEYRTVTRLLVTVITIKQLIVIFESTIADSYVVWLRSLAGIGLLHLFFARLPVSSRFFQEARSTPQPVSSNQGKNERLFPNLLT